MTHLGSIRGAFFRAARHTGKLLTFRFTARGFCLPRLERTLTSNISSSTAWCNALRSLGGGSDENRKLSPQHANSVHVG